MTILAQQLTSWNFAYNRRDEAPRAIRNAMAPVVADRLIERIGRYSGSWVIWDLEDGEDGWLIVGEDLEDLARETANRFEIDLD